MTSSHGNTFCITRDPSQRASNALWFRYLFRFCFIFNSYWVHLFILMYRSGLLHWHKGNRMIIPKSCGVTLRNTGEINHYLTTTKHNKVRTDVYGPCWHNSRTIVTVNTGCPPINIPNRNPSVDADTTSMRHFSVGSMSKRRRSEGLCYLRCTGEELLNVTLDSAGQGLAVDGFCFAGEPNYQG